MTLAGAGLRSVVEATCIHQECKSNTLGKKIDELVSKGVLLKRDADYFHQHRLLGNEAVHEMEAPRREEFVVALQMLEHLLTTIYLMPDMSKKLRELRTGRGAKDIGSL
jgi:hypothetical protein